MISFVIADSSEICSVVLMVEIFMQNHNDSVITPVKNSWKLSVVIYVRKDYYNSTKSQLIHECLTGVFCDWQFTHEKSQSWVIKIWVFHNTGCDLQVTHEIISSTTMRSIVKNVVGTAFFHIFGNFSSYILQARSSPVDSFHLNFHRGPKNKYWGCSSLRFLQFDSFQVQTCHPNGSALACLPRRLKCNWAWVCSKGKRIVLAGRKWCPSTDSAREPPLGRHASGFFLPIDFKCYRKCVKFAQSRWCEGIQFSSHGMCAAWYRAQAWWRHSWEFCVPFAGFISISCGAVYLLAEWN